MTLDVPVSVILASVRPPVIVDECVRSILASLTDMTSAELVIVRDTRPNSGRWWNPHHPRIPIRILYTGGGRGSAYARNLGVEAARHDTLLFTDDDTLVSPAWARQLTKAVMEHGVATGTIRSRTLGFWEECDEMIDSYRVNARDAKGVLKFLSFPSLGIRRAMFAAAPIDLSRANRVDDIELACRLKQAGVRPHLVESPAVAVLYPDSYRTFVQRKIRHGIGMGRLRTQLGGKAWQDLELGRIRDLFRRWISLSRDITERAGPLRRAQLITANLAYCCAFAITAGLMTGLQHRARATRKHRSVADDTLPR